ncbi:ABC transporter ATP-binding protein [Undibacterium sp. CCC2.1]|uniref:ABC transporter ATP-binding protein n=1 Tax=unclassified Undibacterium TaxID=2630295 RepID=UPI002B23D96C|nr:MULTISPECIES: ABC transporter ATP-binding protein [unclassified Undibacterium]MEB0140569.1 ABC transporter ATP-binding protein [Undibacterium sp. CCC2.1]MEB0173611.1 ABC transporter ATP-binding protein [Undibacterium sp. CCC1.1]MEB0177578.1 ABC transporter ATP-binding protein [Undibacterium sp. CCC3.4]MEB0216746.1 ABC transporter ATP-binding protein [Undibacterium sp. 5I2]
MTSFVSPILPRLELTGICKSYPAVIANDHIDLRVAPGEIHAVLGENGAGKSTLMKIIFGAVQPDAGRIVWNGKEVKIATPQHARALGIAMVFQHFSLFDTLTVTENIALGLAPGINMSELAEQIRLTGATYGLELEPQRHVHTLSVGERQRVEIVRALLTRPQLLILDEPTSVLTPQAVQKLFVTLRQIAAEGCSILYISHKLDEIRELCHSATVMRMGKVTAHCDPAAETAASLSRLMIGESLPLPAAPSAVTPGAVRLQLSQLTLPKAHAFATALASIELALRAGEIVGIAGVSGNGQQELLAALSGEDRRCAPATIRLHEQAVGQLGPHARRALGQSLVPEERLGRGAVPELSLTENMLLSQQQAPFVRRGMINFPHTIKAAADIIQRFRVKASGPAAPARSLSGGNLQKFIVGREIMRAPSVFIVAQPTWGVDVGAAAQIHAEIRQLRLAGCAILVISEELDELFELCDRLHVIAKGRLSPSINTAAASREQIGLWMSGLWHDDGSTLAAEVAHA